MKIVTKDNFSRDLYTEVVVAENVNEYIGQELVDQYNKKHWNEYSKEYLALVEDDYEPYNGYKLIYG